jgi:hypothetical protein
MFGVVAGLEVAIIGSPCLAAHFGYCLSTRDPHGRIHA